MVFVALFVPCTVNTNPVAQKAEGHTAADRSIEPGKVRRPRVCDPWAVCLTFYFAKNHTPDSDTSILTSGLSQLRGLGARFANSQVELSFFTCEIYVKLQP